MLDSAPERTRWVQSIMSPKDELRTGNDVEDIVEQICTHMFFSDFTVRSHEFVKSSRKRLEAADVLIPFKDTLLVIQAKSRIDVTHPTDRTPIQWERLRRKADEAVEQIKTVHRFVNSLTTATTLSTSRGLRLRFDPAAIKRIIGIVVFEVIGEEHLSDDERTTIYRGITHRHDLPIHVFMRHDFDQMSVWVNTLPDFLEYLDKRQQLLDREILGQFTTEKEYLAAFILMPQMVADAVAGKCDRLIIDLWEHFQRDEAEVSRIKEIMAPSYAIDHIIARQYETIGYDHEAIEGIVLPDNISAGTRDTYEAIITELASLTRLERIRLGRQLIEVRDKGKGKETGWCRAILLHDGTTAVVLLASERDRSHGRYIGLLNYVDKMRDKQNVKKVIGIATEAGTAIPKSFDVCIWKRE